MNRVQLTVNNIKNNRLWLRAVSLCCFIFLLVISGCQDKVELLVDEEMAVIRISIGGDSLSARTLQPVREDILGYQLTFSGAVVREPVNISEGNSADVALPNGQWIITATAYKLDGTIGNEDDAIASGSITISISGGMVSGSVPPIILTQSGGTGNGVLDYQVTVSSGISGFMRLLDIESNLVNTFKDNGELAVSSSINEEINLAAGRYIIEVRLTNEEDHIAFHRVVIEIWEGATTTFIFEPVNFFDLNMILPVMTYGHFNVESIEFSGISFLSNTLNITADGTYTISMREDLSSTTTNRIVVANGVTADITLSGVNINLSSGGAFDMTGATVTLTLVGDNVLKSGDNRAGLATPEGSTLVITVASTGSLAATGGGWGSGIGGGINGAGGTISINGGTVTATGSGDGAGIGGGGNRAGGTISINGGTVTATSRHGAGIGGGINGAGGTISISGGTVTATGSGGAGIGGGGGGAGGTISISGGTVTATSGSGAGIGGGINGAGGTISISGGTVTATSGYGGAGIGGGSGEAGSVGAGGTISISGGTVTATGSGSGAGIGGGGYRDDYGGGAAGTGAAGTIESISGNAVVFASSIQAEFPSVENLGPAIVFNGNNGTMYGNVTLVRDVVIPASRVLGIQSDQILTIRDNFTLTNNGKIIIHEGGDIRGTVINNQPKVSSLIISGDSSYTYAGFLTIIGDGTYTIGMRDDVMSTTVERIVVSPGVNANITLSDVNIDVSSTSNAIAFDMTGATVNLTLDGDNVLMSGENRAGLGAPEGSKLEITAASTGSLTATGGGSGAGIGGGVPWRGWSLYGEAGGTISINGGTVTATGGGGGAGIGGGWNGDGGTVNITGGTVTATGGSWGSGIGGGINGAGGTIETISGNAVIFASSIQPELPSGENIGPAIIFILYTGTMYGNVELLQNVTFAANRGVLTISSCQTLTIPTGRTLINNGTIRNNGTIIRNGVIDGTGSIIGSQPTP